MSQMQTVGWKQRSTVDNLIILNPIIQNQRQNKNKICLFFVDAKKCFDKLWLKDCLIETYYLGYSPGTFRSLYEINKTSNIIVLTPIGKTSNITVEEIAKQGTIFGPIMYCASTSRVNTCSWGYGQNFKPVYFFFHEKILSVKKAPNAKQTTFTP